MKRWIMVSAGVALIVGGSALFAQDHHAPQAHHAKPLNAVMQELGEKMNALNDAVFRDDWTAIANAARDIAEHPHVMPDELAAISKALDKEMQRFKHLDHLVHENALALSKASGGKNMNTVLAKHQAIMSGCVSCHTKFRTKVQKALKTGK